MIKAEYRRTNAFDAPGQSTPGVEGDRASTAPVLRTLPEGTTADALRAEIVRLYPHAADPTIERAIHALAVRHWHVAYGVSLRAPEPRDRTLDRPRLTRVW